MPTKAQQVIFTTTLKKFNAQGEKTGWTYIEVPAALAGELLPGNKKSFRVKGCIDSHNISGVALIPMGGGDFILAVNAGMRKAIKKEKGASVRVVLEPDSTEPAPPKDLMECLQEEPEALRFFTSLTRGHQNYFGKWIDSAKTETTRTRRIADAVVALSRKMDFGAMLRHLKKEREDRLKEL